LPSNAPPKYVYGFRGWNLDASLGKHWDVNGKTVVETSLRLLPSNKKYGEWLPGTNMATCRRGAVASDDPVNRPHRAGASGCSCGFWCLHKLNDVANNVANPWISNGATVWGSIVGWGQCTRQGNGWRCEYAQVVAFMDPLLATKANPPANLPAGYDWAMCPRCQMVQVGPLIGPSVATDNRRTISHTCGVASMTSPLLLYPDARSIIAVRAETTRAREHGELLKLLSERFDVPLIAKTELEAFTKRTAEGMCEMYDDGVV
jgi:hypothetical protein